MNPFGSVGIWIILGVIAAIVIAFVLLPKEIAVGFAVFVAVAVLIGIFYILSNTRFT